jgi:hypothetical protein
MAFGDNTDVAGILTIWGDARLSMTAPILVLGSGGAAAAALVALADRDLHIAARNLDGAGALLERTRVDGDLLEWGTGVDGAIVVNATPIGMGGEALPIATLANAAGLVDFPYGELQTPAVGEVAGRGLPVADGRDMGSVVFPDSALKIFLTASVAERARRRHKQLKDKGIDVSLSALSKDMADRDRRDAERSVAPLRACPDARMLDTTSMSIEEVVSTVTEWAEQVWG